MSTTTTTTKGFRVEDITFHNARRQSAVEEELRAENPNDYEEVEEVKAPISITPEQVISFYKQKIEVAKDSNEKRVYSQTIKWIIELSETKKKLFNLEAKMVKDESEDYDNEIEE